MGAVLVGDVLFDERGEPCSVTYVAPVQIGNECYRVSFSDGSSIVADAQHLWIAETIASRRSEALRRFKAKRGAAEGRPGRWQCQRRTFPEIVSTIDVAARLRVVVGSSGRKDTNFSVRNCASIHCNEVELPIEPYVLGVWLGDGHSASSYVTRQGVDVLGPSFERLPTGRALIDYWRNRLPRGERAIFEVLIEAWPDGMMRDRIGEVTNFKRPTRDEYISRLVRKKIVEKVGVGQPVRASEALMANVKGG